jgi:nucleoside-diphosphate-sugar epimerase
MIKALVTGGAGFIGSHLVRALLERGAHVCVLDNFSTGKRENLAGLRDRLEVIEGDLCDAAKVRKAMDDIEVIFHEAAFISVPQSLEEPQTCFDVNIGGTGILLEAARAAKVRRVVIASSAAVYGDSDLLPLTEETSLCPLSPYAASKVTNEIYAGLYTRVLGLEVTALRYFNVYGPRQAPDSQYAAAVPIFIRRLLSNQPVTVFGDGGQTRDLIFVEDVVRANLLAAENPQAPGEVFNICTGRETRIIDLLNVLLEMFPDAKKAQFTAPRPGDIYRSVGKPGKAERLLGFRAGTSLMDGLKATVEWIRA